MKTSLLAAAVSAAAILAGTAQAGTGPATTCYPQPGRPCLSMGHTDPFSAKMTPVCDFGKNTDRMVYLMNGCKPPSAKAKKR